MLHSGLKSSFLCDPQDSEDEDIEDSSSDEEEDCEEVRTHIFFCTLYLIATVQPGVVNINCWSTG